MEENFLLDDLGLCKGNKQYKPRKETKETTKSADTCSSPLFFVHEKIEYVLHVNDTCTYTYWVPLLRACFLYMFSKDNENELIEVVKTFHKIYLFHLGLTMSVPETTTDDARPWYAIGRWNLQIQRVLSREQKKKMKTFIIKEGSC